jgi:hypothetical protein
MLPFGLRPNIQAPGSLKSSLKIAVPYVGLVSCVGVTIDVTVGNGVLVAVGGNQTIVGVSVPVGAGVTVGVGVDGVAVVTQAVSPQKNKMNMAMQVTRDMLVVYYGNDTFCQRRVEIENIFWEDEGTLSDFWIEI